MIPGLRFNSSIQLPGTKYVRSMDTQFRKTLLTFINNFKIAKKYQVAILGWSYDFDVIVGQIHCIRMLSEQLSHKNMFWKHSIGIFLSLLECTFHVYKITI